jgi:hypothetical protein
MTDTAIYYLSNHPTEQKLVAYHTLIYRMKEHSLTEECKQKERHTVQQIAYTNHIPLK